jgi:mRNA interferase MazF
MITSQRGDIVVLADRSGRYTGKPRPALVVQADAFPGTDSLVVRLITSVERDAPLLRAPLPSDKETGLARPSWAQIDKLTAVERTQVEQRIGAVGNATMLEVGRRLAVFLGIA